jgi:hypothetical protein
MICAFPRVRQVFGVVIFFCAQQLTGRNSQRRRVQNSAAQRAFRTSQIDKHRDNALTIKSLSTKVRRLEKGNKDLSDTLQMRKEVIQKLEVERRVMKEALEKIESSSAGSSPRTANRRRFGASDRVLMVQQ